MDDVNNSLFGGRGTYIRARPDMRTKELYEFFNIKKLRRELSYVVKAVGFLIRKNREELVKMEEDWKLEFPL